MIKAGSTSWILALTEIIIAFLSGGAFIAILNLFKWWIERRDLRKQQRIPEVLSRIHEVYHILNVILRETDANRVLILRAENGGDVPAVGKDLYSSVVYETFDSKLGPVKDRWHRQILDEEYVHMLLKIAEAGSTQVCSDKLKPCALRDLYEADGVEGAVMYKVSAKEGTFYYLSLHFTEKEHLSSAFRDLLRYSVNELGRLMD